MSDGLNANPTSGEAATGRSEAHPGTLALSLGSVGVVYGDIGTSPLYAFREAVIAAADNHADDGLRPVTHEDLWTMRRLATPVTSPDGEWAIVAVTEPAYKEEETVSDL